MIAMTRISTPHINFPSSGPPAGYNRLHTIMLETSWPEEEPRGDRQRGKKHTDSESRPETDLQLAFADKWNDEEKAKGTATGVFRVSVAITRTVQLAAVAAGIRDCL